MNIKYTPYNVAPKSHYPCLKKGNETGNVVLFISPNNGIVVSLGTGNGSAYTVGEYSGTFSESNFSSVSGKIELTFK